MLSRRITLYYIENITILIDPIITLRLYIIDKNIKEISLAWRRIEISYDKLDQTNEPTLSKIRLE